MANIKLEQITGNIYHAKFKTQYDAASTMMRFSETYENPKFRDKTFTMDEAMDWWAKKDNGEMKYFETWAGFNIPSKVFDKFHQGQFDPLRKKEEDLLVLLTELPKPYYIIATQHDIDKSTLQHEIGHGLYYTDDEYRKKVLAVTKKLPKSKIHKFLEKEGYHKAVWEDETHAYLLDGATNLKEAGIKLDQYRPAMKELRKIYKEHFELNSNKLI